MWLHIRYFPFLYSSQHWSFSSASFKSRAYISHEPMFLLLQRVVKIFFFKVFFFHTSILSLYVVHFSESTLGFEVAFPILSLFSSGKFERTCFSSLTYSNMKNISFAFIWTFSLSLFLITEYWHEFALVMVFLHVHYCTKQGFEVCAWAAASVLLRRLLKVQIFNPISDLRIRNFQYWA